jgi:uncharacterized lipoprotein NlpE involved in copper resistance
LQTYINNRGTIRSRAKAKVFWTLTVLAAVLTLFGCDDQNKSNSREKTKAVDPSAGDSKARVQTSAAQNPPKSADLEGDDKEKVKNKSNVKKDSGSNVKGKSSVKKDKDDKVNTFLNARNLSSRDAGIGVCGMTEREFKALARVANNPNASNGKTIVGGILKANGLDISNKDIESIMSLSARIANSNSEFRTLQKDCGEAKLTFDDLEKEETI